MGRRPGRADGSRTKKEATISYRALRGAPDRGVVAKLPELVRKPCCFPA
jgi:hypothetical protein